MSIITVINWTDQPTNSRTTINTNLANLNTDKLEWPVLSVDSEVALFSATTGKLLKRWNTLTGLYKLVAWIFTTAVNSDLPAMSATVWGAVPTPPNIATQFLNGQWVFSTPAWSGDMVLASAQTNSGLKTFLDTTFWLRNVLNTFTSVFTNANTASRTYTLQDRAWTIADNTDLALKANLASPVFSGKSTMSWRDIIGGTYAPASWAQTVALDLSSTNMHIVSGNASGTAITFTIANVTNNQPFIVSILQGWTTVSTITGWFATIRWAWGTAPTLTATLNVRDVFGFIRTWVNTYDWFIIWQNL